MLTYSWFLSFKKRPSPAPDQKALLLWKISPEPIWMQALVSRRGQGCGNALLTVTGLSFLPGGICLVLPENTGCYRLFAGRLIFHKLHYIGPGKPFRSELNVLICRKLPPATLFFRPILKIGIAYSCFFFSAPALESFAKVIIYQIIKQFSSLLKSLSAESMLIQRAEKRGVGGITLRKTG